MDQDRCKQLLVGCQWVFLPFSPNKQLEIALGELGNWGCDWGEAFNESSVEICEMNENLYIGTFLGAAQATTDSTCFNDMQTP